MYVIELDHHDRQLVRVACNALIDSLLPVLESGFIDGYSDFPASEMDSPALDALALARKTCPRSSEPQTLVPQPQQLDGPRSSVGSRRGFRDPSPLRAMVNSRRDLLVFTGSEHRRRVRVVLRRFGLVHNRRTNGRGGGSAVPASSEGSSTRPPQDITPPRHDGSLIRPIVWFDRPGLSYQVQGFWHVPTAARP